ncbi:MAG: PDZ domain-containing protein [Candidatus Marinimicrobia bacterium]|nr:PDZ domain-containing protein [Candidatus Neomarinimicrobiota bacterium]
MTRFLTVMVVGFMVLTAAMMSPLLAEDKPFGGVGLQVVPTINGELVVLNVLESAPAAEKGLLPGDLIFKVDGFLLHGSDFGKVISEYLWGPIDSSVELFYRRPGVAGVIRVVVQRSMIDPRLTVTPTLKSGVSASSPSGGGSN